MWRWDRGLLNIHRRRLTASHTFLVEQVVAEAKRLGIDVTTDPTDLSFRAGGKILVTNVHRLFNGRSVFGVGAAGEKIGIGTVVIDDAHACLQIVIEQFRVRLPNTHPAYTWIMVDRPWTLTPSMGSVLALLALSVFSTALAFVIYFRLVQTLGSVGTTAQAYLRVPIGVAISILFLGESLSSTGWLGLACVIAGVAAMTFPARKQAAAV